MTDLRKIAEDLAITVELQQMSTAALIGIFERALVAERERCAVIVGTFGMGEAMSNEAVEALEAAASAIQNQDND